MSVCGSERILNFQQESDNRVGFDDDAAPCIMDFQGQDSFGRGNEENSHSFLNGRKTKKIKVLKYFRQNNGEDNVKKVSYEIVIKRTSGRVFVRRLISKYNNFMRSHQAKNKKMKSSSFYRRSDRVEWVNSLFPDKIPNPTPIWALWIFMWSMVVLTGCIVLLRNHISLQELFWILMKQEKHI